MHAHIQRIKKYAPSPFQGRLEFAAVSRPRTSLAAEHPFEPLAFKIFAFILIALACAYLYLVASSILNVMARREALAQSNTIEGQIGGLEQNYFALSQAITPQSATPLGYTKISQISYVYRPGNVGEATPSHDEI